MVHFALIDFRTRFVYGDTFGWFLDRITLSPLDSKNQDISEYHTFQVECSQIAMYWVNLLIYHGFYNWLCIQVDCECVANLLQNV